MSGGQLVAGAEGGGPLRRRLTAGRRRAEGSIPGHACHGLVNHNGPNIPNLNGLVHACLSIEPKHDALIAYTIHESIIIEETEERNSRVSAIHGLEFVVQFCIVSFG